MFKEISASCGGQIHYWQREGSRQTAVVTISGSGVYNFDTILSAKGAAFADEQEIRIHADGMLSETYKEICARMDISAMLSHSYMVGISETMRPTSADPGFPGMRELQGLAVKAVGQENFDRLKGLNELNDYHLLHALNWLSRGDREKRSHALRALPLSVHLFICSPEHAEDIDGSKDFLGSYAAVHNLTRDQARQLQRIEARITQSGLSPAELWAFGLKAARPFVNGESIKASVEANLLACFREVITKLPRAHVDEAKSIDDLTNLVVAGRVLDITTTRTDSTHPHRTVLRAPILRLFNQARPGQLLEACERNKQWRIKHGGNFIDWLRNSVSLLRAAAAHRVLAGELDMARAERISEDLLARRTVSGKDAQWMEQCLTSCAKILDLRSGNSSGAYKPGEIDHALMATAGLREIGALQARWHHRREADTAAFQDIRGDNDWKPLVGELAFEGLSLEEIRSSARLRELAHDQKNCLASFISDIVSANSEKLTLIFAFRNAQGSVVSCCEINGSRKGDSWAWSAPQNLAAGNEDPPEVAERAAAHLLAHLHALPAGVSDHYAALMSLGPGGTADKLARNIQHVGANIWRLDAVDLIFSRLEPVLPRAFKAHGREAVIEQIIAASGWLLPLPTSLPEASSPDPEDVEPEDPWSADPSSFMPEL